MGRVGAGVCHFADYLGDNPSIKAAKIEILAKEEHEKEPSKSIQIFLNDCLAGVELVE